MAAGAYAQEAATLEPITDPHVVAEPASNAVVEQYLAANSNVSRVGVTLSFDAARVAQELKARIPDPCATGRTPELGVLLHADEAVTVEELQQVLVTPAREAYEEIQRIPRTVSRMVKTGTRAVGCALTPWRWGTCWEDVFEEVKETVWDEVKVRFEAVAAVYKEVLVPVIRIQQAIVPIKGDFEYAASVRELSTEFEGSHFRIAVEVEVKVRANVHIDHSPDNLTPRGNTDFTTKFLITQSGTLSIGNDGVIRTDGMGTSFRLMDVMGTDLLIDLVNTTAGTIPAMDLLLDVVGRQVDAELTKRVNEMVLDRTSAFNVKEKVLAFANDFNKPVSLGGEGFLHPNITGVFVATPNGSITADRNLVSTKVGITFQPFATFTGLPEPPPSPSTLIQFGTELVEADQLDVTLPSFISYPFVAQQLKPLVEEFNTSIADVFIASKYVLQRPTAEYGGDNSVRLTAAIEKRKSGRQVGEVVLLAKMRVEAQDTSLCVDPLDGSGHKQCAPLVVGACDEERDPRLCPGKCLPFGRQRSSGGWPEDR